MKRKHAAVIFAVFLAFLASGCARAEALAGVDVPMRDGVALKADVYLPDEKGPFPAIVTRTPYNRAGSKGDGEKYAKRGIAFVAVDVRGRFESGGEWVPFIHEAPDGEDTLKWIRSQPWCNGKIAGFGGSYVGITQWALTAGDMEGLVAIAPIVTTAEVYNVTYRSGAFNLTTGLGWASTVKDGKKVDAVNYIMAQRGMKTLPLIRADNKAGFQIDFYDQWIRHPARDEFWAQSDFAENFEKKNVPALLCAGWYDLFLGPQLQDFVNMRAKGQADTAGRSSIIIGPWDHSGGLISPMIKVPDDSKMQAFTGILEGWYDYWLLGKDNEAAHLPPVRLYVMGAGRWQDFDSWPPAGMTPARWYFHSAGRANSPSDGAALSSAPPGAEPADSYIYDPKDPTPSRGGTVLAGDMGPNNYAGVEERPDVLSYTSAPLDRALEIIGPVTATVYAATTACGTDFVARLLDVSPEGVALPLVDGIVRSQTLTGGAVEPGGVRQYDIDLWATAWSFAPGHRIRVDIASAAFPHWDRNLNTCDAPFGQSSKTVPAEQTVYHNAEHPSYISLPVYAVK